MATLVVLAFKNDTGAAQVRDRLAGLQKRQPLSLDDAAAVVRRQDGRVKVKQAVSLVETGALGGAFWGMLIGQLLAAQWLGQTTEAGSGTAVGYGVDEEFIKEIAAKIEPGHSALFLLVESWTEDKITDELAGFDTEVLQSSLSKECEAKLQAAFGADE